MAAAKHEAAKKRLFSGVPKAAMKDAEEALVLYKKSKDTAGVVATLCTIIQAHAAAEEDDAALRVATEELAQFRGAGDKLGQAKMLWMAAGVHLVKGEPDETQKLAQEALAILPEIPGDQRQLEAQLLVSSANALVVKGCTDEALTTAEQAAQICRATGDKEGRGEALKVTSMVLMESGLQAAQDPQTAVSATREAIVLFRELGNKEGEAIVLFRELGNKEGEASSLCAYANAKLAQGVVGEAVAAAEQALKIFRQVESWRGRKASLDTIVQSHRASGNWPAALEAANKELALVVEAGDKMEELALLKTITDTYMVGKQYAEAFSAAKKSLRIMEELKVKDAEASQLLVVSSLHQILGRPEPAFELAKRALQLSEEAGDKMVEQQSRRVLSEMQVARQQPGLAPNRSLALEALDEMANAVREKNSAKFQAAVQKLNEVSGFTQEEVATAIAEPAAEDRVGTINFLRQHGHNVANPVVMQALVKKELYLSFRAGGLFYGPRFRTCRPSKVNLPGDGCPHTAASLKVYSGQEVWGQELEFHPGLLDGMQHQTMAFEI